jgi:low affinity Fe/Cu permease
MRVDYRRIASSTSYAVGTPWAFLASVLVIVGWTALGPRFHYSDTWQLVINTGTTIITFLMVFLIQGTQNREARITQLKLDELIRAVASARNSLIDMEHMSDEELGRLEQEFEHLRDHTARQRRARRD